MAKKAVKSKSRSVKRKSGFNKKEFSIFMLVFAIIGAFTLWVSLAAPHNGGGSGGSLSLAMVKDVNGDGLPNYADTVTFKVTTSVTAPYVAVSCTQNGTLVFTETNGFFASYPWGQNYDLGPTLSWTGGAADCSARLFSLGSHSKQITLATLPFHVNQ